MKYKTIICAILKDETPYLADCSIIDLNEVGKNFKPFKNSKHIKAMFPSVETKVISSACNILNILYVYVAL